MSRPQSQMKDDRQAANGRQSDDAAATATAIPAAVAAATTEAVRAGADDARTVITAARHWAEDLVGLPVKVLGSDVTPVISGRVWLDGTFEAISAVLSVQRRSVDRFFALQHQIAGQLLDSGWALTTAIGSARRGRAREVDDE